MAITRLPRSGELGSHGGAWPSTLRANCLAVVLLPNGPVAFENLLAALAHGHQKTLAVQAVDQTFGRTEGLHRRCDDSDPGPASSLFPLNGRAGVGLAWWPGRSWLNRREVLVRVGEGDDFRGDVDGHPRQGCQVGVVGRVVGPQ